MGREGEREGGVMTISAAVDLIVLIAILVSRVLNPASVFRP